MGFTRGFIDDFTTDVEVVKVIPGDFLLAFDFRNKLR